MPSRRLLRRLRAESGSTLLLMPAAVLVLFALAAIAVDAAVLFLGQRRLADMAASVAQDAVAAIQQEGFYDDDVRIDLNDALRRRDTLRATLPQDDAFRNPDCGITIDDTDGLRAVVSCDAQVRFIFARVVGGSPTYQVSATEVAVGREG